MTNEIRERKATVKGKLIKIDSDCIVRALQDGVLCGRPVFHGGNWDLAGD